VPSLRFIPSSLVVNAADTRNPFNPIVVPSDSDNPEPVHDDSDTDFEIANKKTGGTFRFMAQSAFLTYPHCHLATEDFIASLETIVNPKIKEYYFVRELHKDGTSHYHILVYFLKKTLSGSKYQVNIKDPYKFDIGGYHYNIQKTRNDLAAWRYLHKWKGESTYVGRTLKKPKSMAKETKAEWWEQAVNYTNKETFVVDFKHHAPREYILNHSNILSFRREAFIATEPVYVPLVMTGIWSVPREMNY